MPYSQKSLAKLATCHPDLERLFIAASERIGSCTIIEGSRSKEAQDAAFANGTSKLKWPNGKHNVTPEHPLSRAVDVMPDPVEFPQNSDSKQEIARKLKKITDFALKVLALAEEMKIRIRWGGDWNMNGDLTDDKWDDLMHYELI